MTKLVLIPIVLLPLALCLSAHAQEVPLEDRVTALEVELAERENKALWEDPVELSKGLRFYGSFRLGVAYSDGSDETEIFEGANRIGFDFRREFAYDLAAFARIEWRLNMVDNDLVVVVDSRDKDTDFNQVSTDTFGTRLGYVGFDFSDLGRLSAGKQWSIYYDVSEWTDQFNVFGGEASGTFNAGTDGGPFGTGRAEKSLQYRNRFGPLDLGLQVQAKGDRGDQFDSNTFDSVGASLTYTAECGISVGAAYNRVFLDDDVVQGLGIGLERDSRAVVGGIKYEDEQLLLSATYAGLRNHERDNSVNGTFFDSIGMELYGHYYVVDEKVRILGGFNRLTEDDSDYLGRYELEYYVVGAAYHFTKSTFVFVEIKFDEGRNADGSGTNDDMYTTGIYFTF